MPSRQWTGERKWMRELRGNRMLREVAEPYGLSPGALSGFEQGRSVPRPQTLPRLAAAYGIDPGIMRAIFLGEVAEFKREHPEERTLVVL